MGNSQEIDKPWWVPYDVIQLINKKEWTTDIRNNTDETPKHYAKWKKSYTTEYILYVSRYVLEQKNTNLWFKKKLRRVVSRTAGVWYSSGLRGRGRRKLFQVTVYIFIRVWVTRIYIIRLSKHSECYIYFKFESNKTPWTNTECQLLVCMCCLHISLKCSKKMDSWINRRLDRWSMCDEANI